MLILIVVTAVVSGFAQDTGSEDEDQQGDNSFFEDPFAVSDEEDDPAEEPTEDSGEDQTDEELDDFDSLFQTDEMIEESEVDEDAVNPSDDLLRTEGVRWGGRVGGSLAADWQWEDIFAQDNEVEEAEQSLSPSLNANLFFDARPEPEFRAYGELEFALDSDGGQLIDIDLNDAVDAVGLPAGWTTEEDENGDTVIRDDSGNVIFTLPADGGDAIAGDDSQEGAVGQAPGVSLSVDELFFDYTWNDELFFRFGKHTIAWGAGYFFSPADVLNLTAVDPEDPTADRQGPVSLRTGYPFGLTGNATLYLIVNQGIELLDVAIAPLVQFVVGPGELGVGAYYQRTLAPRLISLYTASVGDADVFAEAVVVYGSDRVFVRPSRDQTAATADPDDGLDLVLDTFEVNRALFLQATIGGRYIREFTEGGSVVLVGQYFFNGEGYADDTPGLLPAAARLALNPTENGLIIENPEDQPEGYEEPPALGFDDLANFGRHYLGATIALSDIPIEKMSLSFFGLLNLSDFSTIISPSISYSFLDRFSVNASLRMTLGPPDGEFTNPQALFTGDTARPTAGLTITISMPGGSF